MRVSYVHFACEMEHFLVLIVCTTSLKLLEAAVSITNFENKWPQSEAQFVCHSGGILDIRRICDGHTDCYDGSDEIQELCYRLLCPLNHFRCKYGACVHKSLKCNGIRDCADGSDEELCGRKFNSCSKNEFRCKSGHCIPALEVCSGDQDCWDGSDEAPELCQLNLLCPVGAFRCKNGHCVSKAVQCDGFFDCIDGSDESNILCMALQCPKCRATVRCPGIKSFGLDAHCIYHEQDVPCDRPLEAGTFVEYSCKEYYEPANRLDWDNDFTECQGDGTWSHKILQCEPKCGQISAAVPLIMHGWNVQMSFPWHVSMYSSTSSEKSTFWCGATLISELVVITAAHCVWNLSHDSISLLIGAAEHSQTGRYHSVQSVHMHPLYLDKYGNYGSDIALLQLVTPVELSDDILPVCIDWKLDDITAHLSHRSIGIVMGMGTSELGDGTERLRAASLPVASNAHCLAHQKPDFRKFVTFTTFCAGWENGTGVCNGDSGGGLVFYSRASDQWFLQGIVSLSPRNIVTLQCDPFMYTIFTKVGIYVEWIRDVILEIQKSHKIGG